jgi:hypothetical protein
LGFDGSFNFCIGDFGNAVSGNTWRATDLTINWNSGSVGIGIAPQTQSEWFNIFNTFYSGGVQRVNFVSSGNVSCAGLNTAGVVNFTSNFTSLPAFNCYGPA